MSTMLVPQDGYADWSMATTTGAASLVRVRDDDRHLIATLTAAEREGWENRANGWEPVKAGDVLTVEGEPWRFALRMVYP